MTHIEGAWDIFVRDAASHFEVRRGGCEIADAERIKKIGDKPDHTVFNTGPQLPTWIALAPRSLDTPPAQRKPNGECAESTQ